MLSRPFASFVCSLLFVLCPLLSASGQSVFPTCTESSHARILYATESNLERSELEMLRTAKASVDVAMYSFTDHELAEELVKLAQSGVKVRVYRDLREFNEENQRGLSTTAMLMAAGVVVWIKGPRDLMHFKSYVIDGTLLRTGSANWLPTGLKRQDNDVHYEVDPALAAQFEAKFESMWNRTTNVDGREASPKRAGLIATNRHEGSPIDRVIRWYSSA
jgi:phosphatidylserine/phosphatidylglycerophosphate/cardiolipin synthase-like enzyme